MPNNQSVEQPTGPAADVEAEDVPERTYDPTEVEVDRGRQQGLGMGARDLQRQRDPGDRTPDIERG